MPITEKQFTLGHAGFVQQGIRLERRLLLLNWLHSLFGYERTSEVLKDLRDVPEGFDSSGRSYLTLRLVSRGDRLQISDSDLARYDANIRGYISRINHRRDERITLRYFQYLAALYVEVFLDKSSTRPQGMLQSLNSFCSKFSSTTGVSETPIFSLADLKKVALWMATGSGKTIILHINYMQYLSYSTETLDNILLISPNEGMSKQHIDEMLLSGLPCQRFDLQTGGAWVDHSDTVQVIEITKLVGEKRGLGVTVPVEAFEGNNLIFVDEGHKGTGGDVWRTYRDALSSTGFTFEYSATFGQALIAAKNDQLTAEYSRSIIFDYSYRYFYGDGYGKDFSILNIKEDSSVSQTNSLLLGSMLSFYEQRRFYSDNLEKLRQYHIEKPLWIFVGSKVNAVYTENRRKCSDVLTVIKFLAKFLGDRQWAVEVISRFLAGASGLTMETGSDLFLNRLLYLRECAESASQVYEDILVSVFHTRTQGAVQACPIGRAGDEIGLRVSSSSRYFGVIYVGDTKKFLQLLSDDDNEITIQQDMISDSLFRSIGDSQTTIEMLIGAKKFMEGWNSWRVSNMVLLNIGRKEGSEIIQLFGRGVRLRGRQFSLKRTTSLPGSHPNHIELLETLNVFSVRADYMAQFRKYLEKEGVDIGARIEFPIAIRPNKKLLDDGLVIPRLPTDSDFVRSDLMMLDLDPKIEVSVDLGVRAESVESRFGEGSPMSVHGGSEVFIRDNVLELIDWERVYLDVIVYKQDNGFDNLMVRLETLRKLVMEPGREQRFHIFADDNAVDPSRFSDVDGLHQTVVSVVCEYIRCFYRRRHEHWNAENMVYKRLDLSDSNFRDYVVRAPLGERELLAEIEALISEADTLYDSDQATLPTIYFDRHLYQPLLVHADERIISTPLGLNASERRFVLDLRRYWSTRGKDRREDMQLYLLRNLSRGQGVGFFEGRGFYPDFILWNKKGQSQRIVFVEPHGMVHSGPYRNDDKARLYERLSELGKAIHKRTGVRGVTLDSFIISATPYNDLRKVYDDGTWDVQRFSDHHILFFDAGLDGDYIERILFGGC